MSQKIEVHSTNDEGTGINNGREDAGIGGQGTFQIFRNGAEPDSGMQIYYGKNKDGVVEPIAPGGNALPVEDEGVQITPNVTNLNFVGDGVTATAVGNDVTVTIPGGGGFIPAYIYAFTEETVQAIVSGDDVDFSTTGLSSGITHTTAETFEIVSTGIYELEWFVAGDPGTFAGDVTLEIFVNGASAGTGNNYSIGAGGTVINGMTILSLSGGDIVTLRNTEEDFSTLANATGSANTSMRIKRIA